MSKIFDLYISEIKDKILDPEEETRLIKVYQERQKGWEEAQDKVAKSNLMYVVKLAYEFTTDQNRLSDLISEGNVALLDALNKFKIDKGVKFISYANYEIRGRMARVFINESRLGYLNIPERTRIKINKIHKFIEDYKLKHGDKPSINQICKEFEIKNYTAVLYTETLDLKNFSLNDSAFSSVDQRKESVIEDEKIQSPDQELDFKQKSSVIKKIIESLPKRDQYVINKRFGFDGDEPQDLASIGRELNLTRERIRQIEAAALKAIKKEMDNFKMA